jgi:YspA, cpYpsA-related SLOG family
MRIAVVGSRLYTDRAAVEAAIAELPAGVVIVSGGARGPDTWAAEAARGRGLETVVCRPKLAGVRSRGEVAGRYLARNQKIVDQCDRVIAFVVSSRLAGGTGDTIKRAQRAGKPVELRERAP